MRSTSSPIPARRPLSGSARRAMGNVAESILSAVKDGTSPPATAMENPKSAKSISLVFHPRRPPSASQLMKRQCAAFYISLLSDEVDGGSSISPPPTPTTSPRVAPYFETTVKPFLLLKGSSACDRRLVLVTWAQAIAERSFVCLRDGQRPSSATIRSRSSGGGGSAKGRLLSTKERTTFLHFVTRESVVNDVLCAPVVVVTDTAAAATVDPTLSLLMGSNGFAASSFSVASIPGGAPSPSSLLPSGPREQLTYSELLLVLRVTLFCAASVSQSISDFDFRSRYRDRQFTLSQGSDLDSTDEDKDDGAPRPLDAVLLSCAELLLANFPRLGLVDAAGEPREPVDEAALDELLRLIHRLLLNPQAERCYGVLLGLVFYALRVVDRNLRVLSDALGPIVRYVDEQRLFFSMKADGEHMNRELIEMYDRLDGPFYTVVRRLRAQESLRVERAMSAAAMSGSGGVAERGAYELSGLDLLWLPLNDQCLAGSIESAGALAASGGSLRAAGSMSLSMPSQYWLLLQCLERFIAFQAVERDYPRSWIELFHEEMTRREVLLQSQRDELFLFLLHVKRHCPLHGVKEVLSGPAWFQMKAREEALREEIVREECRKHEFFLRIVDAYAKLPLETDPKQVANRIVPTSLPASVASEYDQERVKAVGFASMVPPTGGGRHASRYISAPATAPPVPPPRPPLSRGLASATPSHAVSPFSDSMVSLAAAGTTRPASAKETFHATNRRALDWRMTLALDENAERLGIVQEESDRHFALALNYRLSGTSPRNGFGRVAAAGGEDLSPARRRALEESIAASEASADVAARGLALQAEFRAVVDSEARNRRELRTEESLVREVSLQPAFQRWIVDGLAAQAARRQAAERLAVDVAKLQEKEAAGRGEWNREEQVSRDMITTVALREHSQFAGALALQRLVVLETKSRASVITGESAARDILASLYVLETNLSRRIFAVAPENSRNDRGGDAALRREQEAREVFAQERLNAFMASVEDLQALQRYGRAQVADAETTARFLLALHCRLGADVRLPEQQARRTLASLGIARLQQAARDFLSQGISQLDVDIAAAEGALECLRHPSSSPVEVVDHADAGNSAAAIGGLAASSLPAADDDENNSGHSSDSIRRAASTQLRLAADHAERCLKLQELRALRGAFRYYLFQLRKCSVSVSDDSLERIASGGVRDISRSAVADRELEVNTSSSPNSSHVRLPGEHRASASSANSSSTRALVVHTGEPGEGKRAVAAPPFVCKTRTYLRPLSAAAAAAASSQLRRGSAGRNDARGTSADAPRYSLEGQRAADPLDNSPPLVSSFQLTEKLILFNRVWVSEETRAQSTKVRTEASLERPSD